MLSSFPTRFHNFIWFLIFTFTLYCMPHVELLFPFRIHIGWNEAYASENNSEDTSKAISSDKSTIKEGVSADKADKESTEKKSSEEKAAAGSETQLMSQGTGEGGGSGVLSTSLRTPEPYLFTGAANYKVPIQAPPGRGGIAPNLSLMYNSYQGSGWLGVGWSLDLGSIQRSTKRGLNYSANDYVGSVNGSNSELIARSDWGANYYGSKIEGAFFKYYLNSTTGGWEVTTKDGTKYYYGTTSASRQDNAYGVFKWCLDKVQDTKGNYMTVTYSKDQGEIYLDRVDYTGNGSLSPTNYVKFYLESRTDILWMYKIITLVKTAYRLKTIEVYGNGVLQRKYVLNYNYSPSTNRSLLNFVTQYGSDGISVLPSTTFGWQQKTNGGFNEASSWGGLTYLGSDPSRQAFVDVNGDGLADWIHISGAGGSIVHLGNSQGGFNETPSWGGLTYLGSDPSHQAFVDVNGDGLVDWIHISGAGGGIVHLNNGQGGFNETSSWGGLTYLGSDPSRQKFADVNGDGLADWIHISGAGGGIVHSGNSQGGFNETPSWGGLTYLGSDPSHQTFADVNGDGLVDWIHISGAGGGIVHLSTGPFPDLLSTATNGIGGTSTIAYTPSSAYTNTLMPFILQTVSSISVDDAKGNISTTTYTYEGGLFDYAEREFRGFRKGTTFQMVDAQYYESKTETWFLQDYSSKG